MPKHFISIITYTPEDCGEVNSGEQVTSPFRESLTIQEIVERFTHGQNIDEHITHLDEGRIIENDEDIIPPDSSLDKLDYLQEHIRLQSIINHKNSLSTPPKEVVKEEKETEVTEVIEPTEPPKEGE